jgi:hypothetical protein
LIPDPPDGLSTDLMGATLGVALVFAELVVREFCRSMRFSSVLDWRLELEAGSVTEDLWPPGMADFGVNGLSAGLEECVAALGEGFGPEFWLAAKPEHMTKASTTRAISRFIL